VLDLYKYLLMMCCYRYTKTTSCYTWWS